MTGAMLAGGGTVGSEKSETTIDPIRSDGVKMQASRTDMENKHRLAMKHIPQASRLDPLISIETSCEVANHAYPWKYADRTTPIEIERQLLAKLVPRPVT